MIKGLILNCEIYSASQDEMTESSFMNTYGVLT